MDFNYLYLRQQVSQFRADNASCVEAGRVHGELARCYTQRIDALRNDPVRGSW